MAGKQNINTSVKQNKVKDIKQVKQPANNTAYRQKKRETRKSSEKKKIAVKNQKWRKAGNMSAFAEPMKAIC